jgi:hypothetical protein
VAALVAVAAVPVVQVAAVQALVLLAVREPQGQVTLVAVVALATALLVQAEPVGPVWSISAGQSN